MVSLCEFQIKVIINWIVFSIYSLLPEENVACFILATRMFGLATF